MTAFALELALHASSHAAIHRIATHGLFGDLGDFGLHCLLVRLDVRIKLERARKSRKKHALRILYKTYAGNERVELFVLAQTTMSRHFAATRRTMLDAVPVARF